MVWVHPLLVGDRGWIVVNTWRKMWDLSRPGHRRLSVVSVVCCQVEVSASDLSLVQRSSTECGASLCVIVKPR